MATAFQRRVAGMRPAPMTDEQRREMVKLIHRVTLLFLIARPPWVRDVEDERYTTVDDA